MKKKTTLSFLSRGAAVDTCHCAQQRLNTVCQLFKTDFGRVNNGSLTRTGVVTSVRVSHTIKPLVIRVTPQCSNTTAISVYEQ
jgi:hypothetical protein